MSIARRCALVLVVSALGCGPTIQLPDGNGSTGSEGPAESVGPGTTPMTTATTTSATTIPTASATADTTVGTTPVTTIGTDDGPGTDFVPPDDFPGPGECDMFAQNCPPGEKCMPYANDGGGAWNAVDCFPVDPDPDGLYEPCEVFGIATSGLDTCDVGMICWDVDPETGQGQCMGLCQGSEEEPTCQDPDAMCQVSGNSVLALCIPTCDPLAIECPMGQGCYPANDSFVCAPDASGEGGAAGQTCEFINVCDPGTACIDPALVPTPECIGALGCCSSFCEVGRPPAVCLPGQECTAWYEQGTAPDGFETVGICATP